LYSRITRIHPFVISRKRIWLQVKCSLNERCNT
jgi:hypothetical protein